MKRGKQDYLRVIYELEDNGKARSTDIARKLKISKASVSEMLRKLAKEGFVEVRKYSKVKLTGKGKNYGEKFYTENSIIKRFIKKFLGHDEEKAKEEAHNLEHAFSQKSIEILEQFTEGTKTSVPVYVG